SVLMTNEVFPVETTAPLTTSVVWSSVWAKAGPANARARMKAMRAVIRTCMGASPAGPLLGGQRHPKSLQHQCHRKSNLLNGLDDPAGVSFVEMDRGVFTKGFGGPAPGRSPRARARARARGRAPHGASAGP